MLTMRARRRALLALTVIWLVGGSLAGAADEAPAAGSGNEWAAARVGALAVREALQADVSAMRRLRAAQKQLMQWNLGRAAVGSAVRTLRPEICEEEALKRWCELFPATFGVGEDGR